MDIPKDPQLSRQRMKSEFNTGKSYNCDHSMNEHDLRGTEAHQRHHQLLRTTKGTAGLTIQTCTFSVFDTMTDLRKEIQSSKHVDAFATTTIARKSYHIAALDGLSSSAGAFTSSAPKKKSIS
jgi:hypothetical protein